MGAGVAARGAREHTWIRLIIGQVGLMGTPDRKENYFCFFIHFSMNIEVEIKSRKIARVFRKI
jgi:hypothetical protein